MRLLKFSASWCGPCMKMKPVVAQMVEEHGLELVDIDIDAKESQQMVEAYRVSGVPTLVLEDESGSEIARLTGAKPKRIAEKTLGLI